MTRRRDCTCAGTAPGYPQHEWWCGKPEPADDPLHPLHRTDEPVEYLPAVELHSVPTTGGDERKPSLSDCLRANGVPREHWTAASAATAAFMRAWLLPDDDEQDDDEPDGAA